MPSWHWLLIWDPGITVAALLWNLTTIHQYAQFTFLLVFSQEVIKKLPTRRLAEKER